MNDLCTDIGYKSINKFGEQLCGDHIEIVEKDDGSVILVLADGLGSGVKANILSILTSKIISTMISNNLSIEDCVHTIAATLPVCEVRKVAYSTFTIIHVHNNKEAEIIQYDNPNVIFMRDGKVTELPVTTLNIGGKNILKSKITLQENDMFVAMSDGVIHAGVGMTLNYGWQRDSIIEFLEAIYNDKYAASTFAAILLDECNKLYDTKPGDDTTVSVIKIRQRNQINLMIGPPSDNSEDNKMMSLFFSKTGKHIVCGGTTSNIVSKYLEKPIVPVLDYNNPDVPPIAKIEGVDLVTEGVLTVSKVLENAKLLIDAENYNTDWNFKKDGASLICRLLFEEATNINFFVGRAINPAHQNPNLPINFNIKMQLVNELTETLRKMGKQINVSYF